MRSSSTEATPPPHQPQSLSSKLGINLDPLCATARKQVEDQMAAMVATLEDVVRNALEQQAKETTLHEGTDLPDPAAAKPADDVNMEPAPGSHKRMRSGSPARPPTPRSRTRSPERGTSRSRSPAENPKQKEVKEQMAAFGQKLAPQKKRLREPRLPQPLLLLGQSRKGSSHKGDSYPETLHAPRPSTQQIPGPVHFEESSGPAPGHPAVYNVDNNPVKNANNNFEVHKRAQGLACDSSILFESGDYEPQTQQYLFQNNSMQGCHGVVYHRSVTPSITSSGYDKQLDLYSPSRTRSVRLQVLPLGAAAPGPDPSPCSPPSPAPPATPKHSFVTELTGNPRGLQGSSATNSGPAFFQTMLVQKNALKCILLISQFIICPGKSFFSYRIHG